MKFGIVGLSLSHPYAFSDILIKNGHKIGCVWDGNRERCAEFAIKYNAKKVESFEDFLLEDLDGVFIETESNLHCGMAQRFIKRRIPVFIDKVMSLNPKELKKTIALAKENNSIIMSCSAIRYKPEFLELKNKIKSGELGKVIALSADVRHDMEGYLRKPHTWQDNPETSGGEIMNFGVHGVDPVCSILGPGVKWVHCLKGKAVYECAQSEDTAFINIKFNNGSTGTVSLISCIKDYGFSMKAYGVESVLEAGDTSSLTSNLPADDKYGYEKMVSEFVEGIQKGSMPIPYEEIEEVVKVLIASRISADENRIVYIDEL